MEVKWYAVYTKPRWEKKVSETLTKKKIDNYCPLSLSDRQWSDHKKKIYQPLFTSYVFVRVSEKQHTEIRQVNGIINLVYWLNKPAVIRDKEIETIKEFVEEYQCVRLEKTQVNLNEKMRILSNPIIEHEGNMVAIKNNTVKLTLPSLGYLMIAEVQKTKIEIIPEYSFPTVKNSSFRFAFK